MGPSVKFVLTIIDAFPNQKMGVFFVGKKDKPGVGGSEGGCQKGTIFPFFFLGTLPLPSPCQARLPPASPIILITAVAGSCRLFELSLKRVNVFFLYD